MMANSENTRCPARKGAEGQPRAKQAVFILSGVCREHVPSPEGKMCSELYGNVQRLAEMTSPALQKASNKTDGQANWMGREYDDFQCLPPRSFDVLIDGKLIN